MATLYLIALLAAIAMALTNPAKHLEERRPAADEAVHINPPAEQFVTLPKTGVTLCYETFGRAADPAVLFITGLASSMMTVPAGLLDLLRPASGPHFVVRFDNRDTGRSTAFPVPDDGSPAYALADMVDDVVGLLDSFGVPMHVVGISFGGPIAYSVAARRPNVTRSLSLLYTSPTGAGALPEDDLPPMRQEGVEIAEGIPIPDDLDNRDAWLTYFSDIQLKFMVEPPTEADRGEAHQMAEIIYERGLKGGTLLTSTNHNGAATGRWPRELLAEIEVPALVVSAEEDQFFSAEHGEALAADLSDSKFVLIPDLGHELSRRIRPTLAELLLENFAKGEKYWQGKSLEDRS